MKLQRKIRRFLAGWLPGGEYECTICEYHVRRFLPYRDGARPPLMEALDVIGSDIRNFECPRCGAHDRERHLVQYCRAMNLLDAIREKHILHVAPERHFSGYIKARRPATYVPCDLYPQSNEIARVDILNMEFPSASFDIVIANHVLEHVADDMIAIREIHRVLKPGGYTIMQTPYSSKLRTTWQDAGIKDPQARLHAYGQEDHTRLYGQDIFDRIASAGFRAEIQFHSEVLPDVDSHRTGVNDREPLFLFHKHP